MPIENLNPAERFIWEWRSGRMGGESVCGSCVLDKHSCIDVKGRAKITECPNHVFREPDYEPDGLDLHKRKAEAEMQEEAKI